jgi:hypothetical protein
MDGDERAYMRDMEGLVVGHHDLKQTPNRAQWGVFNVSPNIQ